MSEIHIDAPIQLTEGALKELFRIREEQNIGDQHALRVGVTGGGCSGFSYKLGFDIRREGDEEFTVSGLQVVMNKAHQLYLIGMEIDYVDGLNNRGFSFKNPNASSTCGCGTSFSA